MIVKDTLHIAVRMARHGHGDEAVAIDRRVAGRINLFKPVHDLATISRKQIMEAVT